MFETGDRGSDERLDSNFHAGRMKNAVAREGYVVSECRKKARHSLQWEARKLGPIR